MLQSAVHATQNNITTGFDTLEKERFCSFPHRHGEATGKPETRDETRGSIKTSISCETSFNFDTLWLVASKSMFSYEFSYEPLNLLPQNRCFERGFVNFQHISQNAAPATEFAPCRHLTQPCQCDAQKNTQHDTYKSKCCTCHAKWRWTPPKCCACQENCTTSSENVAKVLRLPHKTTFDTLPNTFEYHEVPRLPHETKQRHMWNLQKWPLLQNLP